MLTISEFIAKRNDEKTVVMVAAQNRRLEEVKGAFRNIAMIFLNSEVWKDVKLYPNIIYLVINDEALTTFREAMGVLGKELLMFAKGAIYENGTGKNVISIECTYTDETIDDVFKTLVQNLCDRGGCDREEIVKLAEKHNRLKDSLAYTPIL